MVTTNSLKDDIRCLVDSLNFFKDDEKHCIQALRTLSDLCSEEKGPALLQSTNGLSSIVRILLTCKSQLVLNQLYLTLGDAVTVSAENKALVCTDKVLQYVQQQMSCVSGDLKALAAISYFLSCLCHNSENAQNKLRNSGCLESMVNLYKHFHPNVQGKNEHEQWFDKADSNSITILGHVSAALSSAINRPRNVENQQVCGPLLNLALSTLTTEVQEDLQLHSIQFIGDCLSQNDEAHRILKMIDGLRLLVQAFESFLSPRAKVSQSHLAKIIDTLTIVVEGSEEWCTKAGELGMIKHVICALQRAFSEAIDLKCFMCLMECLDISERCRRDMLSFDGVPVVVNVMNKRQNNAFAKIGAVILQSCVEHVRGHSKVEKGQGDMYLAAPLLPLPERKKRGSANQHEQVAKSLKAQLRTLQMQTSDPCASEKIKEVIHILECKETGTSSKVLSRSVVDGDVVATAHLKLEKPCGNEEVLEMLREQRLLLESFHGDLNSLKSGIASQTSESVEELSSDSPDICRVEKTRPCLSTSRLCTPFGRTGLVASSLCAQSVPSRKLSLGSHKRLLTPISVRGMTACSSDELCYPRNLALAGRIDSVPGLSSKASRHRQPPLVIYPTNVTESIGDQGFVDEDERPPIGNRCLSAKAALPQPFPSSPLHSRSDAQNARAHATETRKNLCEHLGVLKSDARKDMLLVSAPDPASPLTKVQEWQRSAVITLNDSTSSGSFKMPMTASRRNSRVSKKNKCSTDLRLSLEVTPTESRENVTEARSKDLRHAPVKPVRPNNLRAEGEELGGDSTPEVEPHPGKFFNCPKRVLDFASMEDVTSESEKRKLPEICTERFRAANYANAKKHSDDQVLQSNRCLGCYPFARFPFVVLNSQNLYHLLKQDPLTCPAHAIVAKYCAEVSSEVWMQHRAASPTDSPDAPTDIHAKSISNALCEAQSKPATPKAFRRVNSSISLNRKRGASISYIHPKKVANLSEIAFDEDEIKELGDVHSNTVTCLNRFISTPCSRRIRQDYSDAELKYIQEGVVRYGTRWTAILNSYPFKPGRLATDLASKYKFMKRISE